MLRNMELTSFHTSKKYIYKITTFNSITYEVGMDFQYQKATYSFVGHVCIVIQIVELLHRKFCYDIIIENTFSNSISLDVG